MSFISGYLDYQQAQTEIEQSKTKNQLMKLSLASQARQLETDEKEREVWKGFDATDPVASLQKISGQLGAAGDSKGALDALMGSSHMQEQKIKMIDMAAQAEQRDFAAKQKKRDIVAGALGGAKDEASYAMAIKDIQTQGLDPNAYGLPEKYDPAAISAVRLGSMSVKEQEEMKKGERQERRDDQRSRIEDIKTEAYMQNIQSEIRHRKVQEQLAAAGHAETAKYHRQELGMQALRLQKEDRRISIAEGTAALAQKREARLDKAAEEAQAGKKITQEASILRATKPGKEENNTALALLKDNPNWKMDDEKSKAEAMTIAQEAAEKMREKLRKAGTDDFKPEDLSQIMQEVIDDRFAKGIYKTEGKAKDVYDVGVGKFKFGLTNPFSGKDPETKVSRGKTAPVEAKSKPEAKGKYSVGQVITKGNKKYKVVGGDLNDPEVEEVK